MVYVACVVIGAVAGMLIMSLCVALGDYHRKEQNEEWGRLLRSDGGNSNGESEEGRTEA